MSTDIESVVFPAVTVVLTSCNRFDLLERTLASFSKHNSYPIHRFILIEDSGNDAVRDVTTKFPELNIEVVINSPSLGQFCSIDKAYSMVDTEFIFHCEDDWLFTRPNVVGDSVLLMEADSSVTLVWPRNDLGAPRWMKKEKQQVVRGVSMRPIDPKAHHVWGNFTFNPGLRRLSHYKKMPGGYTVMGEARTSIYLKRQGYRALILADGGVHHIGGDGRSTSFEGATNMLAKLSRFSTRLKRVPISLTRRLSHLKWKFSLLFPGVA
ncbi:glycosyltransferase [Agrobacterium sp. SORGH_AS 787]|uniref:glycosyltransferase n=1 Tax=Agrobacterium sp. SORGH_AS 787 TaxID=3041775 RepID=UPI0032B759F7